MAKPEHTAYMVMADFSHLNGSNIRAGLDTKCVQHDNLKETAAWRLEYQKLQFADSEDSYISFGFDRADKLLGQCRRAAKKQFKKGQRPTFFLRKLTMSEFMAHKEFKKYKGSNPTVQKVFKKYLLLDQLSNGGFQNE